MKFFHDRKHWCDEIAQMLIGVSIGIFLLSFTGLFRNFRYGFLFAMMLLLPALILGERKVHFVCAGFFTLMLVLFFC